MNLNRNTVSILEALVSGNGSASVEELCRALGVNRQLLLYYLGTLNDSLRVAGYPRVELEGDWLSLDSTASAELAATIDAYDRADYAFVKEERHDLMTIMMALRPAPVTIGYLCSFFMVSRSTTTSDIATLRSLLDREGLALVSLGRGGYRIEGDERRLRWRVMDSFYRLDSVVAKRVARGVLLQSVREAVSPTDDQAEDLTEKIEGIVRSSIRAVEDASGEKLSFSLLGELVYYLLCVALRNRVCPTAAAGHSTGVSLEGTPEWDVAARVMEGLRGVGLGIEHGERAYVAALLRGSRVFSLDDPGNASDLRSVQLVSALVEEFERQVCTSIAERDALMARLLPHVRAMVCRISYQVKLPSTILRHVSDNYRQLYNATNLVCKNLEGLTGMSFPPDEVAGLCVYFGSQDFGDHSAGQDLRRPLAYRKILVVCPSGIGTSLLVCQQLRDLLGPGFCYTSCSLRDYPPLDSDTYDLVVTTVDSPLFDERAIVVSPSLTRSQERRLLDWSVRSSMENTPFSGDIMSIIERYVDDSDALSLLGELSAYLGSGGQPPARELRLLDILPASRIQIADEVLGPEDAIRLGCAPLVRDHIVTEEYADKIMRTIDELGLYAEYRHEILVAHAEPGTESHDVGMSLTIFRHPVLFARWGRSYRVIFTLAATDANRHVPAMRDLMALLSSDAACDTLRGWSEDTPEALYLYLGAQLSERVQSG